MPDRFDSMAGNGHRHPSVPVDAAFSVDHVHRLRITRDALDAGHTGPVHLYHGSGSADGLYLQGALRELAARHSNIHYVPCVSREAAPAGCQSGRADDMALTDHPDLTGWRIFLSGNAGMVHAAKRAVYLAGADLSHIHADPFDQKTC